jgi:hypothetical protein
MRLLRNTMCWAALLSIASAAHGQLSTPVQRCIDGYNNKLRLVSQQTGKSARTCLRDAAKGNENDPETCVVADTGGKIAGKEAKVEALYTGGKCGGGEPIQRGAAIGIAAHRGAVTDLVHDLFGDPVTAAVVDLGKDDARCVDTVMKRSVLAFAAIAKGHRQCKKSGLQSGAVLDAATLDAACGTLAQIDTNGKAQSRLNQLAEDVGIACASLAGLATLFPGLDSSCHADSAALGNCVGARTRCRACLALDDADGQHMDCDLFDDGAANESCYAFALGTHTCTFAPTSQLDLINTAFPLALGITGAMSVSCGVTDAAQAADCACDVTSVGPMVVPAIGDLCITPASGCPAGGIDCDGGAARNIDVAADHNIGTCTSNASCATACDAHCNGLGAPYARQTSGCEGFCQGGVNDEMACTQDSDCPGATCIGNNFGSHAGVCNCICEGNGLGSPAGAGQLACSVGLQMHFELPSDGDCLDAAIETVPPRCIGVTTATATGGNVDASNMPGFVFPPGGSTSSGAALSCGAIEGGGLSGLNVVGHTEIFDTNLGDILARLSVVCQ